MRISRQSFQRLGDGEKRVPVAAGLVDIVFVESDRGQFVRVGQPLEDDVGRPSNFLVKG